MVLVEKILEKILRSLIVSGVQVFVGQQTTVGLETPLCVELERG